MLRASTGASKVCKIMAISAVFNGFGPILHTFGVQVAR